MAFAAVFGSSAPQFSRSALTGRSVPRRDELQAHLKSRGIGHAVYYPLALHLQPCFAHLNYRRGSLPVTEVAMDTVLSLPIYPELTRPQQDAVIETVQSFYR